ncbi:MAG TPA: hypothetical protein VFB02_05850 [Bradyrhizobium sp.]|jgi:hypothetical protein|nr:hypothetical protein [Bradyrhizobium sp.]
MRVVLGPRKWLLLTLALSVVVWLIALAGLLSLARHVHDDVPVLLAKKLPLLKTHPSLIFAGDSRTEYQVDPALAAQLMGKRPGDVVNIAYDAGEPLALLAATRRESDVFRNAHVVTSVAPFIFNEGVKSAAIYPQDVAARLSIAQQMTGFLPMRIGTLIRFIREAFASRLAADEDIADRAPVPPALGLVTIDRAEPKDRWPTSIGAHGHYANWNLSGPKTHFEIAALCDMVKLTAKLSVVIPPWAPRYDRASDPTWHERDDQYVALVENAGRACGFEVINLPSIPELAQSDYADEMHVTAKGVPIYTRALVARLKQ